VAGPEGSDLVPKTSAASLPARFERVLARFEPERARGLRIPRVINPNRKAAEDGGGEPPRFSPSAAGSARAALSRTAMIFSPAFSFTVAIIYIDARLDLADLRMRFFNEIALDFGNPFDPSPLFAQLLRQPVLFD